MHTVQKLFTLAVVFLVSVGMVSAQEDPIETNQDITSQAQCFDMLKADLSEVGIFGIPLETLNELTYEDVESRFSRTYKSMSSFGNLEVGEPILSHRLYSFGEQTGYRHPPLSPFPVATESEIWDEPTKQYIVLEEYVTDESNQEHFLNCGFISIGAEDLMSVTRDNYLYDGAGSSLKKTAADGSYKSWYSDFVSFNHQDEPFAEWARIFVYPEATQNEYFSKYTVADAFLGNEVSSYDVLTFYQQSLVTTLDNDETGSVVEKTFVVGEDGELSEVVVPGALQPVEREGIDRMYSKNSYYEAIQARFPEFYDMLAFRGALSYDTFKDIITAEEGVYDERVVTMVNAMYDYTTLRRYYTDKVASENEGVVITSDEFDSVIADIQNADQVVAQAQPESSEPPEETEPAPRSTNKTPYVLGILILALVGIAGGLFYLLYTRKRHEQSKTTEDADTMSDDSINYE